MATSILEMVERLLVTVMVYCSFQMLLLWDQLADPEEYNQLDLVRSIDAHHHHNSGCRHPFKVNETDRFDHPFFVNLSNLS